MTGEGDWGSEVSNGVNALPATELLGARLTRCADYSRAALGIKINFSTEFLCLFVYLLRVC